VTDPPQRARRRGPASPGGRRGGQQGGRRSGRRGGDSGTREAILAAARARFGDLGYDRATIRGIAGDAGVDPALVHHFFGTKEGLFVAAMRLPVNPLEVLDAALAPGARSEGQGLGEHLLRIVLGAWDIAEMRATFLGMLRSATTSEQAAAMLREFATGTILSRIAQLARAAPDDGDAEYRAALVASQVLGLALTRYVLEFDVLKQASPDDLAAAIGPTLDRYLSGDLR
jgi:AcrR family transcriptional regulator